MFNCCKTKVGAKKTVSNLKQFKKNITIFIWKLDSSYEYDCVTTSLKSIGKTF